MSLTTPDASTVPPRLDGVRVLCVDDEPDTLQLFAFVLTQLGAEVVTAMSVAEALAAFERATPAVVLADIAMPAGDGYSLIRTIRARPAEQGGCVPAVALTAYAADADAERALDAGYNVHLAKPIDPLRVCRVIAGMAGIPETSEPAVP
jgi:CheY-like chemotaxis protein